MNSYKLTPNEIQNIEKTLSKGDRVEIIPTKDGVILKRVKLETIK